MMFKQFSLAAGFALAAGGAMAADFAPELVEKGRYIATASDCVACHTGDKSQPFAGNHAIASPVGPIIATNITPSKAFGIGNYTEAQFADAVRRGVRADGARLYPAMPYTAFARITDADIHALYAYFMQGVAPVEVASAETALAFPFNLRFSMIGWNLLFARGGVQVDDPTKSAEWNRGAYLAEGPGHCSTCHTPRGALMQELGSAHLGGAQVGAWHAPNITSDKVAGIGDWSKDEIVSYLATGRAEGRAQAGGSMAEAVEHSFSKLTAADLGAIATYVGEVPPVAGAARFGQGQPGNLTAAFRGLPAPDPASLEGGARLYSANCASCHGFDGQGTKDQYYPSLFHNSVTAGEASGNLVAVILNGLDRETEAGHVFMPPFGGQVNAFNALSDDEVASLANYVYAQYGDGKTTVSPAQVAEIRAGGPASNLVQVVRGLMVAGAVLALFVLVALVIWLRRRR